MESWQRNGREERRVLKKGRAAEKNYQYSCYLQLVSLEGNSHFFRGEANDQQVQILVLFVVENGSSSNLIRNSLGNSGS